MGLVNELQESAERDDVQTLLRKAKRVSAKLRRDDISKWLNNEQNGYPDGAKVPSYRDISISFCYNTNGNLPAGYGQLMRGIVPLPGVGDGLTIPVGHPISTIADWVDSYNAGRGQLYETLDREKADLIRSKLTINRPDLFEQVTLMMQLNESGIRGIPEQVKNRVLDWACDLETAGVTGDGYSFSKTEKETAKTVVFNISHSTIDQLNSSGTNLQRQIRMVNFNIKNSTVGQISESGSNIQVTGTSPERKTVWNHFCSWYGLLGITIGIISAIGGWYALHVQYGLWFFG
ncbi:MAG: hypothetical protein IH984_14875 [Planctomycetes bacterium]|nr:hypothetical protein [Planctomycetota bacterium]